MTRTGNSRSSDTIGRWLPRRRVLSATLLDPRGQAAILIEALPIPSGGVVDLRFESVASPWRQGVWLGSNGPMVIAGVRADSFVIWSDRAPPATEIRFESDDPILWLYNVWDSGRGRRRPESQSATSGMVIDVIEDGSLRYSCNDIGDPPDFNKLVFLVVMRSTSDDEM